MALDHGCNAYCDGDLHCDLVYTGLRNSVTGAIVDYQLPDERWTLEISESYRQRGVSVESIERADEAPPMDAQPYLQEIRPAAGGPSDQDRWLVWWRQS